MSDIALLIVSPEPFITVHVDVPHRCNYTLETTEEHRCCKMHHLIRLFLIALSCLARTEKCQKCIVKLQIHEPQDSEPAVTKTKAALRCIPGILDAMTCKMDNVGILNDRSRVRNSG
jgi:hypothetical protein